MGSDRYVRKLEKKGCGCEGGSNRIFCLGCIKFGLFNEFRTLVTLG